MIPPGPPGAVSAAASALVVCTGNICRSPAAELLIRAALGPGADVRVASAGTAAVVGAPVAGQMATLLGQRGIDVSGHVGRQLAAGEVRSADVVLTMTAEQRSRVVSLVPAAVRRTFTLRELAQLARLLDHQLAGDAPAERLVALAAAAPGLRARRASGAAHDDIEDPYGRADDVFARVLAEIEAAVDAVTVALTGAPTHAA